MWCHEISCHKQRKVELIEVVEDKESKVVQVKCVVCSQGFTAMKYLRQHWLFRHAESDFTLQKEALPLSLKPDQTKKAANDVSRTQPANVPAAVTPQPKAPNAVEKKGRIGAKIRKTYTIDFKLKAIKLVEEAKKRISKKKNPIQYVANKMKVNKSLISKWCKNTKEKLSEYREKNIGSSRTPCRVRRNADLSAKLLRYPLAEAVAVEEYKLRRDRGGKVTKQWLRTRMKVALRLKYGDEAADQFKGSKNWLYRYTKRNDISVRRRTNKKQQSSKEKIEIIQDFHRKLRKAVQSRRQRDPAFDTKWGRWLSCNRWNVDQVPLPFVVDQDRTYADKGAQSVWIAQPGSGLEKRQATLQLVIRPEGEQSVKPTIVFRGLGKISPKEAQEYDKRVHVLFQKNVWIDESTNIKWTKDILIPSILDNGVEQVLFADNVNFQTLQSFHQLCREEANTIVYMFPPNQTDQVQPMDQGERFMMKKKIGLYLDELLEDEENFDKWHRTISAKERRILMTKFVGQAWEELNEDYSEMRKKFYQKTGCLMTADGTDDDKIQPEGFVNYNF